MRRLHTSRSFVLVLLVGLAAGALTFHLHMPSAVLGTNLLWRLELLSYDWRLPARQELADGIVLVAIDKQSSDSIQTWPWPRSLHADMVHRLSAAGARAIGFDVVFSEVSSTAVSDNWLDELPPSSDDLELVKALEQSGRVVLAAMLQDYEADRGDMQSAVVSAQFPYWQFEQAAAGVGIVNFSKDVDGAVRRMSLSYDFQDEAEPSFALAVAQVASGGDVDVRRLAEHRAHPYLADGTMLISYAGPAQTYQTVSFYQALDHEMVPDDLFRDKIVLVGATDPLLQDIHLSPMEGPRGKDMPGVEIQANSLATLLSGRYVWPVALWVTFLVTLLAGLLGAVATRLLRPVRALWSAVLPASLLGVVLPVELLRSHMLWVPMVAPLLALALSYTVMTVMMYVAEERARRAIRAAWQRRVAPEILDVILKNPELAHLSGRRTIATTLFSDIRGFTSMCDAMEPEQVVEVLNEYLSEMTRIIRSHRGTIHKFIGDGIMAVFGDPLPDEHHGEQAVAAALEMHRRLQEIRRASTNDCVRHMKIGVGIHTGELVSGDIGSEQFVEYTVIGATVSVASRLEGLNKDFGTGIIISEATRQMLAGEYDLTELGLQEIRGVADAVRVYAVRVEGEVDQ